MEIEADTSSQTVKDIIAQLGTRYLDTEGAATFTKRSPRSLRKKRVQGDGPVFIRNGRKILYDVVDLVAWMDGQKHRSTSEYSVGHRMKGKRIGQPRKA